MTPIEIINAARLATFDDRPDQHTWEDKQYLVALNDARSLLFSKFPESRITSTGGLTAYSEVAETDLANELAEDAIYRNFYVEFIVFRFFDAGSRDTANRQKAADHKAGYMQALSALAGGR